jgi:hypothetical protein
MEDTGDFITAIDPAFTSICSASADMMRINQDQRPLKDGQVMFKGTYELLMVPVAGSNGASTIEARPPAAFLTAEKQDKSGRYPAALPFSFRVDSLSPGVPGVCEARTDGKPGWRFMAAVKYFAEGSKYLRECHELAWRNPEATPELQSVRDYITADGTLVNQKWLVLSPGDKIKMKLRDGKDNIFRKPNPDQPGVLLVQPSTPLILPHVQAVVWVNCKDEQETIPVPEGSPPETKPVARTVKRVYGSNTYECKGVPSVDPSYDKNMCLSERKHAQKTQGHQLVPIEEFQSHARMPARSAYFYVANYWNTLWVPGGDPNLHGVTVLREDSAPGDYSGTFNDSPVVNLVIRFNLFQWTGRPNTQERYSVKLVCLAADKERLSGAYGILDREPFEAIMEANPEIPVHIEAQLWEGPTLGHTSNAPDVIRADPKMATMRGYYVYGMNEVVPDYLRYFHGPRSLKLSREWVLKEFSTWHSKNAAGRESMMLTPAGDKADRVRRNPLTIFAGDKSVVVALGNGQLSNPADPYSPPAYLAFSGEAITFFTGAHDFYALIGHRMNAEEAACWAGPNPKSGPYADSYIDTLRTAAGVAKKPFHYWIFAVRKDAKRAPPKPRPQVMAVETPEATGSAPLKRDKPDMAQEEEEKGEERKRAHTEQEPEDGEGDDDEEEEYQRVE